jgi:hypothetical protein
MEHEPAGVDGNCTGATLATSASASARADIAYFWKRAEPDAARGTAEPLQEPTSFQGPRGESLHLRGDAWCCS